MGFFTGSIFSQQLMMHTSLRVIIPHDDPKSNKILYLLHGLSDDSSAWTRQSRIEAYAAEHNFMVIMPEVQRSFYRDLPHGSRYFFYVSEELPQICEKLFGFKHDYEKTFVAGLSMGGYGAVKCGLRKPEQYAACASFSGAVDIVSRFHAPDIGESYPEALFYFANGDKLNEEDDLFKLAEKANQLPQKPKIFMTCGTSDFLYQDNLGFKKHLTNLSYDFQYSEWEGDHNWDFWDVSVKKALEFFDAI